MDIILDLLLEYSKRGKIVDHDFIIKVIKLISSNRDLEDYVKKVRFKRSNSNGIMAYGSFAREIIVDMVIIHQVSSRLQSINKTMIRSEFENLMLINAVILQSILHEIEHADQHRKSTSGNTDFETLLLAICCHVDNAFFAQSKLAQILAFKFNIYLSEEFYTNRYLYDQLKKKFAITLPTERMAEINAYKELLNILKPINHEISSVININRTLLYQTYLKGYQTTENKIICPTQQFITDYKELGITGTDSYFNDIFYNIMEQTNNATLEKRLTLGLAISTREYQQTSFHAK